MLAGMITDEEVRRSSLSLSLTPPPSVQTLTPSALQILSRLVLLYFAGETADNPELRQCLSYFFPVYCYSNPANQRRVANVRPSVPPLLSLLVPRERVLTRLSSARAGHDQVPRRAAQRVRRDQGQVEHGDAAADWCAARRLD